MKRALVIGASPKSDRYSNMAVRMLVEKGWEVLPFNPAQDEIEGLKCYNNFTELEGQNIDLLTVYLRPEVLKSYVQDIVKLNPSKIIFNPGTEDDDIINFFIEKNITVQTACTLVLAKTGQI
ncbi:MAG: CoA-binding protein [Spirochaetales bacterium]|nr:CoA-binding protein [Spirochaetales bacterium]